MWFQEVFGPALSHIKQLPIVLTIKALRENLFSATWQASKLENQAHCLFIIFP